MKIVMTNKDSYCKEISPRFSEKKANIKINFDKKYQKIIGFGGALTDSSGYLYSKLSKENKEKLLNLYYGEDGLRYNLARLTIGSCDFSVSDYDYIKDYEGNDFSLAHDEEYILPLLKEAKKISPEILTFASIWSFPKFYKTNDDKCHGGKLKEDCYDLGAKYFTNYVLNMQKEGIEIYGVSIQNEPEAVQTRESCIYTAEEETKLFKFIDKSFKKNNLQTKIYLWDHNRDAILRRANVYFNDEEVKQNAAGLFYHWYDGDKHIELSKVHELYPDKDLIFSEGCIELLNLNRDDPSSALATIENGLRYGKNYILDLLNYSTGFIDWNILLDENGGPNHVGNYCEAPILVNTKTGELNLMPSYFVIKHFSHFIKRGAYRVDLENNSDLLVVALINPNGEKIIIALNENNEEKELNIENNGKILTIEMEKGSIVTVVL